MKNLPFSPCGAQRGAGLDGAPAWHVSNAFGPQARQYLISEPADLDLTRDSFSLVFWFKTVTGGSQAWATKYDKADPDVGLDVARVRQGGVLFSTRAAAEAESGFTLLLLPQFAYLALGAVDENGAFHAVSGIRAAADSRWHQLAVVVDRAAALRLYVDAAPLAAVDISALSRQALGQHYLTFGADPLGQYGLGEGTFDRVCLRAGVLEEKALTALYHAGRLDALRYQIAQHMAALGRAYTPALHAPLEKALRAAAQAQDPAAAYAPLRSAYEAFLAAPQKEALLTVALLGDPHVREVGDACCQNIETQLADTVQCGITPDVLCSVGDNANNSTYAMGKAAFAVFSALMDKYALPCQLVACHGNHDSMYNTPEANYKEGTRAYREGLAPFLSENGPYRKPFAQVDEIYRQVAAQYLGDQADWAGHSYGVTVRGYHFLVLNTDYLPQTGSSKLTPGLDGNKLDPIRHALRLHAGTFDWLRHMLDAYSLNGKPIFVLCHFPFVDSVPLSYYHEIVIEDNSIGRQDAQIRALLSEYKNVIFLCGHLHSGLGLSGPVQVRSDADGPAFWEVNVSAMKPSSRAYAPCPAGWHLFLYEDQIVLRARDFGQHIWLPEYDAVVPIEK